MVLKRTTVWTVIFTVVLNLVYFPALAYSGEQQELDELRTELIGINNLVSQKPAVENRIAEISAEVNSISSRLSAINREMGDIQSRLGVIRMVLVDLNNRLSAGSNLQRRIDGIKNELLQISSQLNSLYGAKQSLDVRENQAKARIGYIQSEVSRISQRINQEKLSQSEISGLVSMLNVYVSEIQQLSQEISDISREKLRVDSEISTYSQRVSQLNAELQRLNQEIARIGNVDFTAVNREIYSYQNELNLLIERNNFLTAEKSQYERRLKELETELIGLQSKLREIQNTEGRIREISNKINAISDKQRNDGDSKTPVDYGNPGLSGGNQAKEAVSALISAYRYDSADWTVGQQVVLDLTFQSTSDSYQTFYGAVTLRKPDGGTVNLPWNFAGLASRESIKVSWTYYPDQAGAYDITFGVWKDSSTPLANSEWLEDCFYVKNKNQTPVSGENIPYSGSEDNLKKIVVTEGSKIFSVINGDTKFSDEFPTAPFSRNGTLYIPLRKVVESLGGTVDWIGYPIVFLNGKIVILRRSTDVINLPGITMIDVRALAGTTGIIVGEINLNSNNVSAYALSCQYQPDNEADVIDEDDYELIDDCVLDCDKTWDSIDEFLVSFDLASQATQCPYPVCAMDNVLAIGSTVAVKYVKGLVRVVQGSKLLRFGVKYGTRVFAISDDVFSQYLKISNLARKVNIHSFKKGLQFQKEVMEKIGLDKLKGIEVTLNGASRVDGIIGKTTEFAGRTLKAGDIVETKAFSARTLEKSLRAEKGTVKQITRYAGELESGNKVHVIFKDQLPDDLIGQFKKILKEQEILDKVDIINGV